MTTTTPAHDADADADADATLLEGLLQLAVAGQTDAEAFQSIGEQVLARLLDTYGTDAQKAA